jgi:DNA repair protein RecO (recombination protein O)
MLNKTRAIVLHHIKYGESSLIVTLYTEKHGRLTCMVSGVRSKKSKFPATLFQPLSLLETDLYYRENRDLQRLKEASCSYHYTTIPFNISKSTIALFLAEVMYLTLREEEGNPTLFSFLFHAFQLLDTQEKGVANFHIWFMLHYSRFLGILPVVSEVFWGHGISADTEIFYEMPAETYAALNSLIESPQGPPKSIKLSNHSRTLLLERLIRHYSLHVDGFSRLKSFAVLQEVFGIQQKA